MTATAIDAPALAAGVRPVDGWRFVAVSDPGLVRALEQAREAYDRHEPGVQERAAAYQRDRGIKRHPVPSPHAKALQEAEAAVAAKLEELIVEGAVIFAGFRSGQLEGGPVAIPLDLLGARRPRGSRCTIRGVEFFNVCLYPAEALAAAEPEAEVPPPTTDRLLETLAGLFLEDQAWETLGPAKLAPVVAQRDRRFRPGNGIWAAATLVDKIKIVKQAAKAKARAQGA